jgi:hypothetical protein
VGRRQVEGRFDGGSMTGDGGVMLLSATDRKIGLTAAAARCIADPRNPLLITHAVRDMLRQRVYGLALGWEDLNDHKALRQGVAMQTAVGVDREVASAPTLCRLASWADRATAVHLSELLVEQFIASFERAPEELVLDFDATDNPLHGQQEQRFFHGYHDCCCYLPLYVSCGQQLLCAYLGPSRDGGVRATGAARRVPAHGHEAAPGRRVQLRRAELAARAARDHAAGVGRAGPQPALRGDEPGWRTRRAVRRSVLPARRGREPRQGGASRPVRHPHLLPANFSGVPPPSSAPEASSRS